MPRNLNDSIPNALDFRYSEFVKSEIAIRRGIDNTPQDWHWENVERLARNILQPLRDQFGPIRITSGFRCIGLCEAIGSNANSNHARGEAADIEPINIQIRLYDILEWIHNTKDYRELIAEYFPSGWVHVAYREGDNNRQLKLKDDQHDFARVELETIKELYG